MKLAALELSWPGWLFFVWPLVWLLAVCGLTWHGAFDLLTWATRVQLSFALKAIAWYACGIAVQWYWPLRYVQSMKARRAWKEFLLGHLVIAVAGPWAFVLGMPC